MSTRILSIALTILSLYQLAYAEPNGNGRISDMGHLSIGDRVTDARNFLTSNPSQSVLSSETEWRFEKPIWGLKRVRFEEGRISELSGTKINLANLEQPIQTGDSYKSLLERGLPEPSKVEGTWRDGTAVWVLNDQLSVVSTKGQWQIEETKREAHVLTITFKNDLVDDIALAKAPQK